MSHETQQYRPQPEVVSNAERMLAEASPLELARAEEMYLAYGGVTDGKSAVTGAELPLFAECRPLVKAGWLAA